MLPGATNRLEYLFQYGMQDVMVGVLLGVHLGGLLFCYFWRDWMERNVDHGRWGRLISNSGDNVV